MLPTYVNWNTECRQILDGENMVLEKKTDDRHMFF